MGFAPFPVKQAVALEGPIKGPTTDRATRFNWRVLLWIATLGGALVRLPRAGAWPLYGDEASTVLASTSEFTWSNLRPLAFAFNHYIAVPLLGQTEFAFRLGSVIAGICAVPLGGLAVRRWYGPEAGLGAAFMIALSPTLVVHSQFARYYMQAMLFSGALLYCLYEWSRTRSPRWLAWAGCWFLVGWFTVQSTSFVLPGFLLWVVANPHASGLSALPKWVQHHWRYAALVGAAALTVGFALLLRLVGAEGEQLATTVRYYSPSGLLLSLANGFGPSVAFLMAAAIPVCWTDATLERADRTFLPLVTLGTLATFAAAFPFLAIGPAHILSAAGLPLIGLCGYALGRVARDTIPHGLGLATSAAILLLGSRELASTQIDGGRPDYPWAIRLIEERAHADGALVFATSHAVVNYYAPQLGARELVADRDSLAWLRDPARRQSAFAIVAETRRGPEVDEALLGVHDVAPACHLVGRRERPRLDYSIAAVRVYECVPRNVQP